MMKTKLVTKINKPNRIVILSQLQWKRIKIQKSVISKILKTLPARNLKIKNSKIC
jgi:hypothetical protein